MVPASWAQENIAALMRAPISSSLENIVFNNTANKTTALSLPFFEDFTDYSLYPNKLRWMDSNVYINNTMAVGQISRGVATFDALNKKGRPYDTVNPYTSRGGDTLRSQAVDLGGFSPSDSLYLSFFYQPQGNGFAPEKEDSFMLFFRKPNAMQWTKVWATGGGALQPFRQSMVAVVDTAYFSPDFQFMFVSKSSLGINDDIWNLDYIRLAANRTFNDVEIEDVAFTSNPTPLLKDYTAMSYKQFLANASNEIASNFTDSIKNNGTSTSSINYGYSVTDVSSGMQLGSGTNNALVPPNTVRSIMFPTYNTSVPGSGNQKVTFKHTWYLQGLYPNEPRENDTIVYNQVFDNYLAYDDGTAEKSYFLNLFSSLPGKTAIEFKLNVADTLGGMAIYFGQQAPTSSNKPFNIVVYKSIAGINGATTDELLYSEDFKMPVFSETINDFTNYKFIDPVILPAGVFYLGTTQPAFSGADSLYIALDVNRVGGNHLYYNVLNSWQGSGVQGALMIRPLLGLNFVGLGVKEKDNNFLVRKLQVYPNPATNTLNVKGLPSGIHVYQYAISDVLGKLVHSGNYMDQGIYLKGNLVAGFYQIRISENGKIIGVSKFIKR